MPTSIHGHFLWHELMTSDTDAARVFYKKVVGWQPTAWEHDPSYTLLICGKAPMGGLMAIPPEAQGAPPNWMLYVGTDDAGATAKAIQALGGTVLREPWDVPGAGRMAVVQDPQGVVFAIFTPANVPTPTYPVAIGDFSWHELATTDPDAAFDFYTRLFGWQKTGENDMGPMGLYQMFGLNGVSFGGMFRKPADMPAPPHWLVYARVYDSVRVAAAAKRAGGTVINGPMEVPGGDWIAQIVDPQGAVFAVHSVKAEPAAKATAKKAAARKAATAKAAAKRPAAAKGVAKKAAAKKSAKTKVVRAKTVKAKAVKKPLRKTTRQATRKAAKRRAVKAVRKAAKRPSARRK